MFYTLIILFPLIPSSNQEFPLVVMARTRISELLCYSLLAIFILPSCGLSSKIDGKYEKLRSKGLGIFQLPSRELHQLFFPKETIHDEIEPPVTPNKSAIPGANPSSTPAPVPSTDPTNSSTPPSPPSTLVTQPVMPPPTTPVPVPSINTTNSSPPPSLPSTNPVTQPVMPPPTIANVPHNPVQRWCVAKNGAPQAALQAALDYACGVGGVDCSVVQQGGSCYNPVTLVNHASYAFNSFYQRNPVPTSCDFGGTAMVTSTNPSSGSCIFPTSSSTSTSSVPPPVTQTPAQTPPNPSTVPTPPAFSTPPAAPTLPVVSTPPAAPTPSVLPTPPASSAFPTPPASSTPPVSSSGTTVPRVTGSPVSANSTNNTKSGVPMGGFPNIFPTVSTSMPPAISPSATSNSNESALSGRFIGSVIALAFIVTWNHIFGLLDVICAMHKQT